MNPDAWSQPSRRRVLLALAALATVVVLMIGVVAMGATAANPDVARVQTVAREALIAEHEIGIVPNGGNAVTQAVREQMLAQARDLVTTHYTGTLMQTRLAQFQDAVRAAGGGGPIVLDGGAKDISFGNVTIDGTSATVRLRATTFLKVAQSVDGPVANPQNIADYRFQLEKVDGRWLIVDEELEFVPGFGP